MHGASLAGRLILIVEDEHLIAIDVANAFTNAGARVVSVRSLRDALIAAENSGLSAAVLGQALSDGDSSKLCERLKERDIPFVLHSGYGQIDGTCSNGALVAKLTNPQVLLRTVEDLLRRPARR